MKLENNPKASLVTLVWKTPHHYHHFLHNVCIEPLTSVVYFLNAIRGYWTCWDMPIHSTSDWTCVSACPFHSLQKGFLFACTMAVHVETSVRGRKKYKHPGGVSRCDGQCFSWHWMKNRETFIQLKIWAKSCKSAKFSFAANPRTHESSSFNGLVQLKKNLNMKEILVHDSKIQ